MSDDPTSKVAEFRRENIEELRELKRSFHRQGIEILKIDERVTKLEEEKNQKH
jgi:hypothetical protein